MCIREEMSDVNTRVLFSLVVAFIASVPCRAVSVGVELWAQGEPASKVEAILHATPIVGDAAEREAGRRSIPIEVPGKGKLSLPEGKTWKVDLETEEYWSEPAVVTTAGDEGPSIRIELHPTGSVASGLRFAKSEDPPPPEIVVHFNSRERRTSDTEGFRGSTRCPIVDSRWQCRVPIGILDFRLQIPGFVSHFFFDREVSPSKPLSFGNLSFVRGASLGGFVHAEDDSPVNEECCALLLRPRAGDRNDPGGETKRMAVTATVNEFAFFLFDGVAPGAYVLEATHEKLTKITVDSIVIHPETELFLRDTLVFRRPVEATFSITPPVDVTGKRWALELMATQPTFSRAGSGKADASGNWRKSGLQPGKYLLTIFDSSGARVGFEELEMAQEEASFTIELDTVWAEGEVRLGDEKLAASLFFGGVSGVVSVRMDSDDEGLFSGYLPRDGEWDVDIKVKDPKIFRRLRHVEVKEGQDGVAYVDVELPDTLLEVEVDDDRGNPVHGAMVLVMRFPATEKPSFDRTDEDGVFSVRGLDYSEFRIQAVAMSPQGLLRSDPIAATLSEASPSTSVELVVRRTKKLRGKVVASVGTAVPGARIELEQVMTGDLLNMLIQGAQTDHDGSFELEVPPDLQKVSATVLAPGFVLSLIEISADPSQENVIPLSQDGGGTLVVELAEPSGRIFGDQPSVSLVFDGRHTFNAGTLSQWANMNGQSSSKPLTLQVPFMPAGTYSACWPTHADEGGGTECDDGFLSSNGLLELSRPEESQ